MFIPSSVVRLKLVAEHRMTDMLYYFVLAVIGLASTASVAAAENGTCFTDWAAASRVVATEGLVTLDQLSKSSQDKLGGDIVRSSLCEASSGYVYKLVVRDAQGRLKNVLLDAKTPF
jgi:uncharacterized membrane protein YkoI